MAEKKVAVAKPSKVFYFKNRSYSQLSVVLNNSDDVNEYEVVRFRARVEDWQGNKVKVGYLKVTDPKVADKVKAAEGVEEITQKEFEG